MGRRSYTREERAATLAALASNSGNVAKTAQQCGVPRQTLQRWMEDEVPQGAAGAAKAAAPQKVKVAVQAALDAEPAKVNLALECRKVAEKLVGVANQKADLLNAKDAMIAAGVAIDKYRLLVGEPTTIDEVRTPHDPATLKGMTLDELFCLYRDLLGRDAASERRRALPAPGGPYRSS